MDYCDACDQGIPGKSGVFVDLDKKEIVVSLRIGPVRPQQALIMEALADCYPRAATFDFLLDRLYLHESEEPEDPIRVVRVAINHLRHALESAGIGIVTHAGSGYSLKVH